MSIGLIGDHVAGLNEHFGKSMYAFQLLEWVAWVPKDQLYLMTLENFAADPVGEYEALLQWMGLPIYDDTGDHGPRQANQPYNGFRSRDELARALEGKRNAAKASDARQQRYDDQVVPVLGLIEEAFQIHNQYLQVLLTGTMGDGKWADISALLEYGARNARSAPT